jgi:excisionase family DNA binding protein
LAEQLNRPFYTVPEVAELLGMHPETIRRALREGRLKGIKLGGRKSHYRIPAEALERFIREEGND